MAAFLRTGLPPAKLRAGKRRDGNDQHNEVVFLIYAPGAA
jgi:hypothetical protein